MRGEAASSTTYSDMNESSIKFRKMYVDHPNDRLKLTYIIHGPGNSLYECKVLGDFGSKYYKSRTNKDHRHEPVAKKKFIRQQEKNDIFHH